MLRWTCRLRDAFEARGFLSSEEDSMVLSQIKEAEFVVAPNEAFPHEFRWETFCSCFKHALFQREVTLVHSGADVAQGPHLVPAMNGSCWASRSARTMNGQAVSDLGHGDINILWLSPTVFISSVKFLETDQVQDYTVGLGGRRWSITQLPAFDEVEFDEPSRLPIDFFGHLAPSEKLGTLELDRSSSHPNRFPVDYMMRLMSLVPLAGEVVLGGLINIDELREILSYQFQPVVKLSFSDAPFDDSVSLDVLMELLKTAPYLRHIELPPQIFLPEDPSDVKLYVEVDSPALSMHYAYRVSPTSDALSVISKIHQADDITCFRLFVRGLWEGGHTALVTSVVHPFLDGRLSLENLRIQVSDEITAPFPDLNAFRQELARAMISCRSKHLCRFNVLLFAWDMSYDEDSEDADGVIKWNIHRIRQWDEGIFPQVVLNQCNKQMTKALDGRLLPRTIGAINRGILYRKSTDHIPCDMSTANAGLIFHHIKTEAVKSGQY
jgi:hypothetical protein